MDWPKLTPDQHQAIVNGLHTIDDLHKVLDALESCGEQCQQRRKEVADTQQNLNNLLKYFAAR